MYRSYRRPETYAIFFLCWHLILWLCVHIEEKHSVKPVEWEIPTPLQAVRFSAKRMVLTSGRKVDDVKKQKERKEDCALAHCTYAANFSLNCCALLPCTTCISYIIIMSTHIFKDQQLFVCNSSAWLRKAFSILHMWIHITRSSQLFFSSLDINLLLDLAIEMVSMLMKDGSVLY